MIAGIDYSTRAVDVVLLDEDSDAATWHRFELEGQDAFDRSRSVPMALPGWSSEFWDEVIAVGIEDPRGYNAGALYRVQGAILACLQFERLVHPLIPSQWRKTVGLPGNASKGLVRQHANGIRLQAVAYENLGRRTYPSTFEDWPSDPCDAYCIALATRSLLQHGSVAA